jgi:hypothetical protein
MALVLQFCRERAREKYVQGVFERDDAVSFYCLQTS